MKSRFLRQFQSLMLVALMLIPAACASAAERQNNLVGTNDAGFTFCGVDMGDRSLTRDDILKAVYAQTSMEAQPYSDIEWVIPSYQVRPACLGGYADMTSLMFEEIDGVLLWGADTLLLPVETPDETLYSYETANGVFEDSMERLAEIYGSPDEAALSYWDAAQQEVVTFKLASEAFFSSVWSMVERSEYGVISAAYGNAVVRLQHDRVEDESIYTCWLYLGAYEE